MPHLRQRGPVCGKWRVVSRHVAGPFGPGHLHHAPQQAAVRALAQPDPSVPLHAPDNAAPDRFDLLRHLPRIRGLVAGRVRRAIGSPRASAAVRRTRRADRCPQIHDRLRVITGAAGIGDLAGERCDVLLGLRQGRFHPEHPRDDALHIAVDDAGGLVERRRQDRIGRVITNSRKRFQSLQRLGKDSAGAGHLPCAGNQVARSRIIAQPRPGGQDRVIVLGSQALDGRPRLQKAVPVGRRVRDCRLLQHDFRQPDCIGIRLPAHSAVFRAKAPRQRPARPVIPVEQRRAQARNRRG